MLPISRLPKVRAEKVHENRTHVRGTPRAPREKTSNSTLASNKCQPFCTFESCGHLLRQHGQPIQVQSSNLLDVQNRLFLSFSMCVYVFFASPRVVVIVFCAFESAVKWHWNYYNFYYHSFFISFLRSFKWVIMTNKLIAKSKSISSELFAKNSVIERIIHKLCLSLPKTNKMSHEVQWIEFLAPFATVWAQEKALVQKLIEFPVVSFAPTVGIRAVHFETHDITQNVATSFALY